MNTNLQTDKFLIAEPTYKAAQAVAPVIEKHFAFQIAAAASRGEKKLALEPSANVIAAVIDVTFWASLRKEEGRSPKISLAFLPPDIAGNPLLFATRLPLTANILTKLGPAVERPGIHLGIWYENEELFIWGTTRDIPGFCFVLEVVEPGLLVVKHKRTDAYGKFVNVAVLKGDEVKIIDEQTTTLADCPALVTSLLGFNTPKSWDISLNVHVQLAASMRAHGHGGTLLVIPSDNDTWRESIIHPINYAVEPSFCNLANLIAQPVTERNWMIWEEELSREVENIAGLTAVDGATIINDRHELLAFGAKIGRAPKSERIRQMMITEPIIGTEPIVVHPGQDGGTRHLSAAQFVFDQHDAIALVASQDGKFTVFSWSPCAGVNGMVHAHQVDALLL